MCTVSWARDGLGYTLIFNRDERRTRGPEEAPRVHERDGVRFLAPTDGDAGGTWITVNEHGVVVCLLNGYVPSVGTAAPEPRSRGLLVLDLATAANTDELQARLTELQRYEPFVLLALLPEGSAQVWRWDGASLALEVEGERAMLASSGHDQPAVQAARAARYDELKEASDGEFLVRFQEDHGTGPSAFSPCMHRDDAETKSQCRVKVTTERVELVHVPGAPCRTAPGPELRLDRRPTLVR